MSKNFFHNGKWIDKTTGPSVLRCKCGNKYIKTRREQNACLTCFVKRKYV